MPYINIFYFSIYDIFIYHTYLGEEEKLKDKAIYFVRTTPPGKPIAAGTASDESVLFGQVSEHSIKTLETLVNAIYAPMVNKL